MAQTVAQIADEVDRETLRFAPARGGRAQLGFGAGEDFFQQPFARIVDRALSELHQGAADLQLGAVTHSGLGTFIEQIEDAGAAYLAILIAPLEGQLAMLGQALGGKMHPAIVDARGCRVIGTDLNREVIWPHRNA